MPDLPSGAPQQAIADSSPRNQGPRGASQFRGAARLAIAEGPLGEPGQFSTFRISFDLPVPIRRVVLGEPRTQSTEFCGIQLFNLQDPTHMPHLQILHCRCNTETVNAHYCPAERACSRISPSAFPKLIRVPAASVTLRPEGTMPGTASCAV